MASETTRQRLLDSATRLFARRGYEGASVRDICNDADVNANAIHYHFGSKQNLYAAILDGFARERLGAAERMLAGDARDLSELRLRLELFCDETMVSMLTDPDVLAITMSEMFSGFVHGGQQLADALRVHEQFLTDYLSRARERGLLRADVDTAVVAGTLLERVVNQARYVDVHEALWNTTPRDPEYRRHWVGQMVELCLFGAARRQEE